VRICIADCERASRAMVFVRSMNDVYEEKCDGRGVRAFNSESDMAGAHAPKGRGKQMPVRRMRTVLLLGGVLRR
jgi:hypothetical protein